MQPGLTRLASIPAPITCRQRLLPILLRRAAISQLWNTRRTRARTLADAAFSPPANFYRSVQSNFVEKRKKERNRRINFSKDHPDFFERKSNNGKGGWKDRRVCWTLVDSLLLSFLSLGKEEGKLIGSVRSRSWNDTVSFASRLKYLKFLPTRTATRQLEH